MTFGKRHPFVEIQSFGTLCEVNIEVFNLTKVDVRITFNNYSGTCLIPLSLRPVSVCGLVFGPYSERVLLNSQEW